MILSKQVHFFGLVPGSDLHAAAAGSPASFSPYGRQPPDAGSLFPHGLPGDVAARCPLPTDAASCRQLLLRTRRTTLQSNRDDFGQWIREVSGGVLCVDPQGCHQAIENMVSFGFGEVPCTLTSDDISWLLCRLKELRRQQIRELNLGAMVFYAWLDEQSGTLRTSLITGDETAKLPFGCPIRCHTDLTLTADEVVGCPYLKGIPYSELEEVGPDELPEIGPPLNVYVEVLNADGPGAA
ncbi:hypothetical protein [Planctomicrobium sp. SH664]|uniref:hypothetical protein n=1 Tax=Planctomicrobium sp. SH664 TaxID=3448125 RepID=UPI003F5BE61F